MYAFHFDYIRNKYVNNSRLLSTDTDNLMYEIRTEDVLKVLAGITVVDIKVFIGFNREMYCFLVDDGSEKRM